MTCINKTGTGGSDSVTYTSSSAANQTTSYLAVSSVSLGSSGAIYTSPGTSVGISTSSIPAIESTTTTEPCENQSITFSSATTSEASSALSQDISTSSTEELSLIISSTLAQEATMTSTSIESSVSSSGQTRSVTITPIPTESCVIDTSMVPVTSAPLTSVPSSNLVPTKTVCQDDAPTGKPMPENHHCGVHGLPVGNYFLARFVENSTRVPVTLEGCYQFCASVMYAADGCKSYRLYPERGLNVTLYDLCGSNVGYRPRLC